MNRCVIRLDLRSTTGEEAVARAGALLSGEEQPDLRLLLLVDDARALKAHQRAYETLTSSGYTDELLCVAVGPIDGNPPRLEVPGNLAQGAGIIWVPDPCGIDWELAAAAPATRRKRSHGPETELLRLLDVLSQPEVFHGTLSRVRRTPDLIANPGLRLAGPSGDAGDLQPAMASAAARILAPGRGRAPELPGGEEHGQSRPIRLRSGGPLAVAADEARTAVAEATAVAGELIDGASLFTGAPGAEAVAADAGRHLKALRARLEDLLSAAHTTTGLTTRQQEAIERAGVVLPGFEEFEPAVARDAISGYLTRGLRAGASLPVLIGGLDEWQERLTPAGSGARLPDLRRACPDELLTRLLRPLPMPEPQRWLPAIGLVTAALATFAPFGPAGGVLMAALWTLLVALTVTRGPGGRLGARAGALVANAAAGAAGVVCGTVITIRAIPAPLPPEVWAPLLVAALTLALGAARASWRSRAGAWARDRGLDSAERAVGDLLAVATAAAGDWARAGARAATADAAARVGAALEQVSAVIRNHVSSAQVMPRPDPRIERCLADLVERAMAPRVRDLAAGSTAEHAECARVVTTELLAVWQAHASEHGVYAPPPFARERDGEAAALPEEELPELIAAAGADAHATMWQLCAAEDLPLLDLGSAPTAVVRFAPLRDRAALEDLLPAGTVWTRSARRAGTLRLVPARPGIAYQSRAGEAEQEAGR
ncbi:hypothetical protein [Nonomuraea ferruginea]